MGSGAEDVGGRTPFVVWCGDGSGGVVSRGFTEEEAEAIVAASPFREKFPTSGTFHPRKVCSHQTFGARRLPRARGHRSRSVARRASSASRDGPSDEPDPADAGLTPLQRSCLCLGEAFRLAVSDVRTFDAFCEIAAIRVASENARRLAA